MKFHLFLAVLFVFGFVSPSFAATVERKTLDNSVEVLLAPPKSAPASEKIPLAAVTESQTEVQVIAKGLMDPVHAIAADGDITKIASIKIDKDGNVLLNNETGKETRKIILNLDQRNILSEYLNRLTDNTLAKHLADDLSKSSPLTASSNVTPPGNTPATPAPISPPPLPASK